jgi:hypothetical protein
MPLGNPHRPPLKDTSIEVELQEQPRHLSDEVDMDVCEQPIMESASIPEAPTPLGHEVFQEDRSPSERLVPLNASAPIVPLEQTDPLELDMDISPVVKSVPWLSSVAWLATSITAIATYLTVAWFLSVLNDLPGGLYAWGLIGGVLGVFSAISIFRLWLCWQKLPTQKGESLKKHQSKKSDSSQQLQRIEHWLGEHKKQLQDIYSPIRALYIKNECSVDQQVLQIDQALLDIQDRPEEWKKNLSQQEGSPLKSLDQVSKKIILHHAKHLGLKTAALPRGWLDGLAILWNLTALSRELGVLYGIRTGKSDTFKLLVIGIQHILISSQLDQLDQHIVASWGAPAASGETAVTEGLESHGEAIQGILGTVLGTVAGKVAEGSANALLCMRFGYSLRKILQKW